MDKQITMLKIPGWAKAPNHKEKVVATEKGWVVESTGEVLRRVNDLPTKLKNLREEVSVMDKQLSGVVDDKKPKRGGRKLGSKNKKKPLPEPDINKVDDETKQPKKRKGRKPGSKNKKKKEPELKIDDTNKGNV